MPDAVVLAQALLNGVGVGLIYGLVGVGYSVIYNSSGIVNFSQGVFVMLGGMVTHTLLTAAGLPIAVAALLATAIVAGVGALIQLLVVRPMLDRSATLFAIILATLASQIIVERLVILTLGDQPRTFSEFTSGGPILIAGVVINPQFLWILAAGVIISLLLWLFFQRTGLGRALRACSENAESASLLGIPVNRMLLVAFMLSGGLGAIAGILITPTQYTAFNVANSFGIAGFIAAIVGGFGSAPGALLGGILLGVLQAAAIVMFGAGYKNVAALSVLLVFLLVFPTGFLGKAEHAH